jgi:hypothetical protein
LPIGAARNPTAFFADALDSPGCGGMVKVSETRFHGVQQRAGLRTEKGSVDEFCPLMRGMRERP